MNVNISIKQTKRRKVESEEQIQEIPNTQLLATLRIKEEVNIMLCSGMWQ